MEPRRVAVTADLLRRADAVYAAFVDKYPDIDDGDRAAFDLATWVLDNFGDRLPGVETDAVFQVDRIR